MMVIARTSAVGDSHETGSGRGSERTPFRAPPACLQGRGDLDQRGRLIGPYDLMIAAHATSVDAVAVTDNTTKFERVAGLRTENWLTT